MRSRSTTEKMTFSLLVYDPAITPLSDNTSTDLNHLKIRSSRAAASKYKISFTGSENVRMKDKECLGTTKGPYSGLPLELGM